MRKETRKYYFSVEGETEKWYLDWLQKTINAIPDSKYNVKLDSKIQKDPLARVKGMTLIDEIEITHVFDRKNKNPTHARRVGGCAHEHRVVRGQGVQDDAVRLVALARLVGRFEGRLADRELGRAAAARVLRAGDLDLRPADVLVLDEGLELGRAHKGVIEGRRGSLVNFLNFSI